MDRILIPNGPKNQQKSFQAALNWLVLSGGGTVVMDAKKTLLSVLNDPTETEFKRYIERMKRAGIRFAWLRGKGDNMLPNSGNVVALFPTKRLIDAMESRSINSLLVVGWVKTEHAEWAKEKNPKTCDIEDWPL